MAKYFLVLLLSSVSFGADVLALGIRTGFRYSDLDHQCYLPPLGRNFTFSAEIEKGSVIRAKLKKNLLDSFSEILELNSEEIKDIQVQELGTTLWIKQWRVSGRVLDMLIRGGSDEGYDACSPPEKLASIRPDSFDFIFDFKNGGAFSYHDSNLGVFQGQTESGRTYRFELEMIEETL